VGAMTITSARLSDSNIANTEFVLVNFLLIFI
jgi:hypothetical protein